ncbi:MAG: hypothetical protein PVH02_19335 [Desulfobacteraceae bacterium]|jgi:hypothetical protein
MSGEMTSSSTDKKEIRKFGIIAFVFFGCLCALGLWRQKPVAIYLFGVLSLLGMGFIWLPSPLKPVYDAWLRIAHLIGRAVTIVMLTLAYYLVITPSALIKRIFGGRPLPIRPDKELASYWVTRPEPAQPKERFIKRF